MVKNIVPTEYNNEGVIDMISKGEKPCKRDHMAGSLKKTTIIASLALLLACVSVFAIADTGDDVDAGNTITVDNIAYELTTERTITVVDGKQVSGDVSIPSTIKISNADFPVTAIGDAAFNGCAGISSVTLPDGVKTIGNDAFKECRNLTKAVIPEDLVTIGDEAFLACQNLTDINFPNSIAAMGANAFSQTGLTTATFPSSMTEISTYLMASCSNLTSITLPSNIKTIGSHAFSQNPLLSSVTIEEGLTEIGEFAFGNDPKLTTFTIPDTVVSLGHGAFTMCTGLTSITIPDSVTTLSNAVFNGCGLTSAVLSNNVTSMGDGVFSMCTSLASVTMPENMETLGNGIFSGCSALTQLTISGKGTGDISILNSNNFGDQAWNVADAGDVKELIIDTPDEINIDAVSMIDGKGLKITSGSDNVIGADGKIIYDGVAVSGKDRAGKEYTVKEGQWSGGATPFKVTVTIDPTEGGEVTGAGPYTSGSEATLTATPNEGYRFKEWSDGSTEAERTVTVSADIAYTAEFVKTHIVTVTAEDNGTVTGGGVYDEDSTVSIEAVPNEGYDFDKWSDGDHNAKRVLTVVQDVNMTAKFVPKQFNVNVTTDQTEAGTVAVGGTGPFDYGSDVTIKATPNEGYRFKDWSDGNTEAERTVTVGVGDNAYTAEFVKTYTVAVTAEDNGTVAGGGVFDEGSTASIEAVPNEGYDFSKWSDGDTNAKRDIQVTTDVDLLAEFTIKTFTVNVVADPAEGGTATGGKTYNYGETATITATPNEGYEFKGWSDDQSTDTSKTFTVTENKDITATFALKKFNVNATADQTEGGTVTVEGTGPFDYGSDVTIKATPNEGYRFVEWSDGNTEPERTVDVTDDVNITAVFVAQHDVTVTAEGNGHVEGADQQTYDEGTKLSLSAIADDGYHFVKWSDDNTDENREVTVSDDISLTAKFEVNAPDQFTISVTVEGNGTVDGAGVFDEGTEITLKANPDEGHAFKEWSDGSTDVEKKITVSKNESLTATFVPMEFTVNVTADPAEGGTVTGGNTYNYGETATITATPNEGYEFKGWSDDQSTDLTKTFNVTENKDITATFALKTFTVNVTADPAEGGTATVDGNGPFDYGTDVSIKAVPNEGYAFKEWSDGSTEPERTVTVNANVDLTATFVAEEPDSVIIDGLIYTKTSDTTAEVSGYDRTQYTNPDMLTAIDVKGSVEIGGSTLAVTAIGDSAFEECNKLETASLPDGLLTIGWGAFIDCDELVITELPDSVTTISDWAFCSDIHVAISALPADVKSVGDASFTACFGITELSIPDTIQKIKGSSFNDCNNLTKVIIVGDGSGSSNILDGISKWNLAGAENIDTIEVDDTGEISIEKIPIIDGKKLIITEGSNNVTGADGNVVYNGNVVTGEDRAGKEYTASNGQWVATGQYTVTLTADPIEGGTVTGDGTYDPGTSVDIKAIPNEGYSFEKWSDDNTESERTITVNDDTDLTATFVVDVPVGEGTISVSSDGHGTVTGAGTYPEGTEVTIKAIPDEGYHFEKWSDGNTEQERTLTVTPDMDLSPVFVEDQTTEPEVEYVTISNASVENGKIKGAGTYPEGTDVTIQAIPDEGYKFDKWFDGSTDQERTIVAEPGMDMIPIFVIDEERTGVIHNDPNSHGIVEGAGTYLEGKDVTIRAIPDEGYHFEKWSDGSTESERYLVISSDTDLSAVFVENDEDMFTITTSDTEHGSVHGIGTYPKGTEIDVTAIPDEGYKFGGWSDGNTDQTRTVTVTEDMTFTPVFAENDDNEYTVTVEKTEHGTVDGIGTYPKGTEVDVTAVPDSGYHFDRWSDGSTDPEMTITVGADTALTPIFSEDDDNGDVDDANDNGIDMKVVLAIIILIIVILVVIAVLLRNRNKKNE